jgi:hypothetical protein
MQIKYPRIYAKFFALIFLTMLSFISCKKKDPKTELVLNNTAPYYNAVSRVKVENYVNRLFIDVIGREPTDAEMALETNNLIANNLEISKRELLIIKLQSDSTYRAGDSSYAIAANNRIYDLLTIRLCEGFGEAEFMSEFGPLKLGITIDSINGNWASYYAKRKKADAIYAAAKARWAYYHNKIEIEDYCAILINNDATFTKTLSYMGNEDNTIKYTYNDLLNRQYSQVEFTTARNMILNEQSGILFGKSGHNKGDYFTIITHCNEFYESTVYWLYKTYIARAPSVEETISAMINLPIDKDIFKIQRNILKTDEYANF